LQRPATRIDIGHNRETASQALEKFRAHFELCLDYNREGRHPIDQIEVIHGYGSSGRGGAIAQRLRLFLDDHEIPFRIPDGPIGAGTTIVEILPAVKTVDPQTGVDFESAFRSSLAAALAASESSSATPKSDRDRLQEIDLRFSNHPDRARAHRQLLRLLRTPVPTDDVVDRLSQFDPVLVRIIIYAGMRDGALHVFKSRLCRSDIVPPSHPRSPA